MSEGAMDKSQVLGLARQAGFSVNEGIVHCIGIDHTKEILALAELAMAAEREACAIACESVLLERGPAKRLDILCAEAIRGRAIDPQE